MAGTHGQTLATGEEWVIGGAFNASTEAQSQYQATEAATFSGMRGAIASGGDGTNTFRFRNNGANGNQVAAVSGAVAFEDASHTDVVSAGNTFNGSYVDTGTDSVVRTIAFNVEFADGHGNFHASSGSGNLVMDVASSTRYLPIHGIAPADGASAANLGNAQFKVREYTSIEAFQVRINANARLNDSTFSVNVNGVDVGTAITFATTVTGRQVVTGMGIALSPGDLVCISMTLGTGVEDLNFGFCGVTMKSTANASAAGYGAVANVNVLETTPVYFSFGNGSVGVEASAQVKVGFAARCKYLRCYLSDNVGAVDGTLSLFVNGAPVMTVLIPVGVSGWIENLTDSYDIADTDVVSFEIVGSAAGFDVTAHQVWISFEPIPDEPTPPPTSTPTGGGGRHRQRRRILLEDGRIYIPGTDEEYRAYVEALLARALERAEQRANPLPEAVERPRRVGRRPKPKPPMPPKSALPAGLPDQFFEILARGQRNVLNSHKIARAWAAYVAEEADEEEALTMLLSF